jgi:urease accessory protein UreF
MIRRARVVQPKSIPSRICGNVELRSWLHDSQFRSGAPASLKIISSCCCLNRKSNLKSFRIEVLPLDGTLFTCTLKQGMTPHEQSLCAPAPELDAARTRAENLFGELRPLLRQIGSPGVASNSAAPFCAAADTLPALNDFLEDYLTRLLLPCELPAIVEACGHTRRGKWRELLAQDLRLEEVIQRTPFAEPSRRVGRLQLARLRSLRDERTVQRYLAAVQSGQARGWHTMVYGVTLGVYSLPLRQGLLYYSQETLSALAFGASRSRNFDELELSEMISRFLARMPEAVSLTLQQQGFVNQVSTAGETVG